MLLKLLCYSFLIFLSIPIVFFTYITLKPVTWNLEKFKENPEDYKEVEKIITEKKIFLEARDFKLKVTEAGDPKNKMILFIHGFPETGLISWKKQIKFFADKGYFVVVPDNRGFGESVDEKLIDPKNSNFIESSKDCIELIKYYNKSKAIVVSHDWGGMVAYQVAQDSNLVEKLIVMNSFHPNFSSYKFIPLQFIKSWYMYYFQINGLAEYQALKENSGYFMELLNLGKIEPAHSREDLRRLLSFWKSENVMTYMLNWYRYFLRTYLPANIFRKNVPIIKAPVLMIFGGDDAYVEIDSAKTSVSKDICENGKFVLLEGFGHFVQHEAPDKVNQEIFNFIK